MAVTLNQAIQPKVVGPLFRFRGLGGGSRFVVGWELGPLEGDAPDEPRSGSSVLVMDELNFHHHIVVQ